MKNIIKTLIPLATGLVVGVVVGRVNNKEKLNADFEKVVISDLDVSKMTATTSKFDELKHQVDSKLFGNNSGLTICKDKAYINAKTIKLDGTIEFE